MAAIPAGAGSLLGKRLGKYEILALLALGGTAEIYLARIGGAAGFEKYVVVKCLHDHLADDQEFVKMFLDEARLAAHLDHSNIVQTFELGEYENRYYMVMEFLAGLSLAMIVRRAGERLSGGRLPVPLVLNIIAQACAGLHYSHEKTANGKPLNIVHRDISPQNLVVSFEGVVKVVDYGIAKAELRETRTRSGTIKGKFAYMSPEQCVANNVDRRTDVFALGVIAHELLTGRRLFKRPSPYETYQAVIECNVGPPSSVNHELDPALDAVIMKAVAKDKEGRYPTAEAFGDALQSYLHHRGKGSGPGDVGRFLDEKFAIEIDEHGQRMRELIAGRPADTGGWDEEEENRQKESERDIGNETVDYRKQAREAAEGAGSSERSLVLETNDIEEMRPSEASLESEVARISRGQKNQRLESEGGSTDVGAEPQADDMAADRTRIETNPLERPAIVHDRLSLSDMSQNHVAPLPAPPTGPVRASGFPEAANLPTMIAELDEDSKPPPIPPAPPSIQVSRSMQHAAVNPSRGYTPPVPMAPVIPPGMSASMQVQTPPPGVMAVPDYPQIPPDFTAQQALLERETLEAQQYQPPPPQQQQDYGQYQQPQYDQQQQGYPQYDQQQQQQYSGYDPQAYNGQQSYPEVDPAQLMSPVGDAYPQVDWGQAAAQPVRVVPTWMLVLIFVGALGVALLVTFLVAMAVR